MRAIGLLTVTSLCLPTICASAADLAPNTIVASGYAEILTRPDTANIDIGVVTPALTAQAALRANSAEMSRVVAAIHAMGIHDDQLQTSNFSIEAQHPTDKNGVEDQARTTGYVATNKLTVAVSDLSSIAEIIDAAVKAGANSSNSVTFDVKNRAAFDDQALTRAIENARHNADTMAVAEHLSVGRMISATNDISLVGRAGSFVPPPEFAIANAPLPPVLPGQVSVDARVDAIFVLGGPEK